jgi:cytochrome c-type biogenesis protein CcmH
MMLWLMFALMTAATIFAVLWPLGRRKPLRPGSDVAVYRDQLDEIQRDHSAGLIGTAEAEAARVEVSRRLIAAADAAETEKPALETSSLLRRRITAVAGLVLLPAGAVALYLTLGSPDLPGVPLAARVETPSEARKIETMVAQVEDHVLRNPNDGHAWEVLAPVYMRVGRYDDAVRAFRNSLSLNGSDAAREADLGEAMVFAANGVVTADAKTQFDRALKIDGKDVMARFYLGMAADQDGRRPEAEKIWRDLLAEAPPDAPWVEMVRHALNRTAPTDTAAAAPPAPGGASAAPPADHDVNAMVERLANRLKKDGSDVNGWVQLVRSYRALDQNDKAQAAAADARRALATDTDKLRQFAEGTEGSAPAASAAPAPPAAPPAPGAAAAGPTAADIAAAEQMKPDQQNEMIRTMVARLADRLKHDGSDVAGWERLLRAYMVLGDHAKALAAAADARKALASDPDKLRRLDEVIKDLKVEG